MIRTHKSNKWVKNYFSDHNKYTHYKVNKNALATVCELFDDVIENKTTHPNEITCPKCLSEISIYKEVYEWEQLLKSKNPNVNQF